jgi:hypothetical protein
MIYVIRAFISNIVHPCAVSFLSCTGMIRFFSVR